jgi:hypothetical protein
MEHGHSLPIDNYYLPDSAWTKVRNAIIGIGAIGWLASIAGFLISKEQFFFSYLTAFCFYLFITIGAIFFVQIQYLTGSVWSVTLRRIMENLAAVAPWAALLYVPIALGLKTLYEWSHPEIVAKDEILQGRTTYFGTGFFFARVIVFFLIWCFLSLRIQKRSVDMDQTHDPKNIFKNEAISAPGLLLLFLSGSLAAWDWIMSLQPHWYSTMFGVYCLAGGALGFMAVVTLVSLSLRDNGFLTNTITLEHYHDLGKWMFAITVFWTYIAFSQYMLIWYANMPEETIYFKNRFEGSWLWVSVFLIFGHFFFPFFLLLCRPAKRILGILRFAAIWILFVCFVDMYWMISPVLHKDGLSIHWLDIATLLAVGSVFAFGFWSRFRKNAMIPLGDIRLKRALAFTNQ